MSAAVIRTTHGTYSGRTVGSIIRREYGRRAFYEPSADRNAPHLGLVLLRDLRNRAMFEVLATVWLIDGPMGQMGDDL